ncbi:hypothetical protein MIR68_011546 [Amoeboaphelidium protococcarum]|nr:hypothetical protein MIR68_011546 [Amoeboaphelidium protococcarum]
MKYYKRLNLSKKGAQSQQHQLKDGERWNLLWELMAYLNLALCESAIDPQSGVDVYQVLNYIGDVYRYAGRNEDAFSFYQKAAQTYPIFSLACSRMAMTLFTIITAHHQQLQLKQSRSDKDGKSVKGIKAEDVNRSTILDVIFYSCVAISKKQPASDAMSNLQKFLQSYQKYALSNMNSVVDVFALLFQSLMFTGYDDHSLLQSYESLLLGVPQQSFNSDQIEKLLIALAFAVKTVWDKIAGVGEQSQIGANNADNAAVDQEADGKIKWQLIWNFTTLITTIQHFIKQNKNIEQSFQLVLILTWLNDNVRIAEKILEYIAALAMADREYFKRQLSQFCGALLDFDFQSVYFSKDSSLLQILDGVEFLELQLSYQVEQYQQAINLLSQRIAVFNDALQKSALNISAAPFQPQPAETASASLSRVQGSKISTKLLGDVSSSSVSQQLKPSATQASADSESQRQAINQQSTAAALRLLQTSIQQMNQDFKIDDLQEQCTQVVISKEMFGDLPRIRELIELGKIVLHVPIAVYEDFRRTQFQSKVSKQAFDFIEDLKRGSGVKISSAYEKRPYKGNVVQLDDYSRSFVECMLYAAQQHGQITVATILPKIIQACRENKIQIWSRF